jgi:hypothetical protein
MAIYQIGQDSIQTIRSTSFGDAQLRERDDLQRLLRDQIEVVAPDVLVIAEEFGEWAESRRRIDLLGVDKEANLVVFELKRTADGGHMELQAVRYAAMVSTLTTAKAVEIYGQYLQDREREEDAEQALLDFLEWEQMDDDKFGQDVRIVLVAANFSRELMTAVMWLNEKDLDVRCVRMQPYSYDKQTLIDVQQVVPIPEAADYQVQLREKKRHERQARKSSVDFTRYDVTIAGVTHPAQWKRNAILLVVKHLAAEGVLPADISEALKDVRSRVWRTVDGEIRDSDEFRESASRDAESGGRSYDDRRWHTNEGDLVVSEGKTYAFSNQWGRKRWDPAMLALKRVFSSVEVAWDPVE